MTAEKTLNDLTTDELQEAILYVSDAYHNRSLTRPEMIAELQNVYKLSNDAASKIQAAVTAARVRPFLYELRG